MKGIELKGMPFNTQYKSMVEKHIQEAYMANINKSEVDIELDANTEMIRVDGWLQSLHHHKQE